MNRLKITIIVIVLLAMMIPPISAQSSHDPLCEWGEITGTEVLIDGVWYFHPDAWDWENVPKTLSIGPFPVHTNLSSNIVRTELWYKYGGDPYFSVVPMTGGTGIIPVASSLSYYLPYVVVDFYIVGYYPDGSVEYDEIAYECSPLNHGDPYSFIIIRPSGVIHQAVLLFDDLVAEGSLEGYGPGASADGRLNALREGLVIARDLASWGDIDVACSVLRMVQHRVDGSTRPPDFATGDGVNILYDKLEDVKELIKCSP